MNVLKNQLLFQGLPRGQTGALDTVSPPVAVAHHTGTLGGGSGAIFGPHASDVFTETNREGGLS